MSAPASLDYVNSCLSILFLQGYFVDCEEQGSSLEFVVPRDLADGFINNKRENYNFR